MANNGTLTFDPGQVGKPPKPLKKGSLPAAGAPSEQPILPPEPQDVYTPGASAQVPSDPTVPVTPESQIPQLIEILKDQIQHLSSHEEELLADLEVAASAIESGDMASGMRMLEAIKTYLELREDIRTASGLTSAKKNALRQKAWQEFEAIAAQIKTGEEPTPFTSTQEALLSARLTYYQSKHWGQGFSNFLTNIEQAIESGNLDAAEALLKFCDTILSARKMIKQLTKLIGNQDLPENVRDLYEQARAQLRTEIADILAGELNSAMTHSELAASKINQAQQAISDYNAQKEAEIQAQYTERASYLLENFGPDTEAFEPIWQALGTAGAELCSLSEIVQEALTSGHFDENAVESLNKLGQLLQKGAKKLNNQQFYAMVEDVHDYLAQLAQAHNSGGALQVQALRSASVGMIGLGPAIAGLQGDSDGALGVSGIFTLGHQVTLYQQLDALSHSDSPEAQAAYHELQAKLLDVGACDSIADLVNVLDNLIYMRETGHLPKWLQPLWVQQVFMQKIADHHIIHQVLSDIECGKVVQMIESIAVIIVSAAFAEIGGGLIAAELGIGGGVGGFLLTQAIVAPIFTTINGTISSSLGLQDWWQSPQDFLKNVALDYGMFVATGGAMRIYGLLFRAPASTLGKLFYRGGSLLTEYMAFNGYSLALQTGEAALSDELTMSYVFSGVNLEEVFRENAVMLIGLKIGGFIAKPILSPLREGLLESANPQLLQDVRQFETEAGELAKKLGEFQDKGGEVGDYLEMRRSQVLSLEKKVELLTELKEYGFATEAEIAEARAALATAKEALATFEAQPLDLAATIEVRTAEPAQLSAVDLTGTPIMEAYAKINKGEPPVTFEAQIDLTQPTGPNLSEQFAAQYGSLPDSSYVAVRIRYNFGGSESYLFLIDQKANVANFLNSTGLYFPGKLALNSPYECLLYMSKSPEGWHLDLIKSSNPEVKGEGQMLASLSALLSGHLAGETVTAQVVNTKLAGWLADNYSAGFMSEAQFAANKGAFNSSVHQQVLPLIDKLVEHGILTEAEATELRQIDPLNETARIYNRLAEILSSRPECLSGEMRPLQYLFKAISDHQIGSEMVLPEWPIQISVTETAAQGERIINITPSEAPEMMEMQDLLEDVPGAEVLYIQDPITLIKKGETSEYVYIVLDGKAEVRMTGSGESAEYATGLLGEMNVLLGIGATAEVVAQPGARVLRVPAEVFKQYLLDNPAATAHVTELMFDRFNENMEQFFTSQESIGKLFPEGTIPESQEHPQVTEVISAQDILKAFETGGPAGLAKLISEHVVEQALRGRPEGLEHWLNISRGEATVEDALYIFEMFEHGQTHLHPTRSLPLEAVLELATRRLAEADFNWDAVQTKLAKSQRMLEILEESGFTSIREVFEKAISGDAAERARAKEALTKLMTYTPEEGMGDLADYLGTGNFISSLYRTPADISFAAQAVAEAQYAEGVRYMELRFSADQAGLSPQQVIEAQVQGLIAAMQAHPGLECKAIIIFDTTMSAEQANNMAKAMLEFAQAHPELAQYVVGIDTAGPEVSNTGRNGGLVLPDAVGEKLGGTLESNGNTAFYFDLNKFSEAFNLVRDGFAALGLDLNLTTHSGENFATLEQGFGNIQRALELGAVRIGHGVILGIDIRAYIETLPTNAEGLHVDALGQAYTEARIAELIGLQDALLSEVASRGVVIEVCPESNTHTSPLTYSTHPILVFLEKGIRVSMSDDNAFLDQTSNAKQLIKWAKAQIAAGGEVSFSDIAQLMIGSVNYGMTSLSDTRLKLGSVADISGRAVLGVESFVHDIPDMVKSLVVPDEAVASTPVAYLEITAEGLKVTSADSFGLTQVGESVTVEGPLTETRTIDLQNAEGADPKLAQLAGGQRYLNLIPVKNAAGEVVGVVAVGSADPNFASNPLVAETATALGSSLSLAAYISQFTQAPCGAKLLSAYLTDTQAVLNSGGMLTEVYVNLSMHTLNTQFGYQAGDALLAETYQAIRGYAEAQGVRVTVYQNGANLIVRVEDQMSSSSLQQFMAGLHTEIGKIEKLTLKDGTTVNLSASVAAKLAAQTYDGVIDNPTDQPLSASEAKQAGAQMIGLINSGKVDANSIFTLDVEGIRSQSLAGRIEPIDLRPMSEVWPQAWEALRQVVMAELSARGITYSSTDLEMIMAERFVEADSGLFNKQALDVLGGEGWGSVGFFDGNGFGAFAKEYGMLGSQMTDAAILRISLLADMVFAKHGIMVFRHGPRSEEFYLMGNCSKAEMTAALAEFNAKLTEEFNFNATVGELMATAAGQKYLAEHPEIPIADPAYQIPVDITELERIGLTGLSVTSGVTAITPNLTFTQAMEQAKDVAQWAKDNNPAREAISASGDSYDGMDVWYVNP